MEIIEIYKNSSSHKVISCDLMANMLNHCYLLSSVDDELREKFALYIAKEILCKNDSKPCDKCINCEKINHTNMVDLKVFPEKDKSLVVEDIANIVSDSYIRPIESEYKIYILNNFDNCTVQGQNKILKTLEEPPQNVIFILTCSNINNVLTTILSRSKKITESTLQISVVEEYLKDMNINNAEVIAGMSGGNISNALKLIKNNNVNEIISLIYDILLNLRSSSDVLKYSSKVLALKKDIEFFIDTFVTVLRDIVVFRNGGELSFKNATKNYASLGAIYNNEMIEKISKKICLIVNKMEFNCNINSVVDKFLLDILEVKFLCQK